MLAVALLLPLVDGPVVPGSALSAEAQWAAVLACPRVSVTGRAVTEGTGVVVGAKDGFAYLLTAAHVVPYDGVTVQFTTRQEYPKWNRRTAEDTEVVERWPDADLALLRFRVPERQVVWFRIRDPQAVSQLPLAGPGQRPKSFPFPAWTVGLTGGEMTVRVDRVGSKQAIRPPDRGLTFYWETDHLPERGRSGGPLLDGHGRVIGLCEAARGSHGYYTHLDEILAALKRGGHGWLVTPKP